MELMHIKPCGECPWRKAAPAGWTGGFGAEMYADALMANEVPACHQKDDGPDSEDTAMCAGALAVAANQCILPHRTIGGPEAREEVGRRKDCFGSIYEFYKHHAKKDYVHPLMR